MKKNLHNSKIIFSFFCCVVLIASISQTTITGFPNNNIPDATLDNGRDGATYRWNDEFTDTNLIDQSFSSNISVNTSAGTVVMKNSYPAWATYPDWLRLRPIEITNSGSVSLHQYVSDIIISFDADMQSDFDDIRFADQNAYPLSYWIAEKTNSVSAHVFIKIPVLPPGVTTIFMFYGNSIASDASDPSIFSWDEIGTEDQRVSWTLATEGAWDPHVSAGDASFCVTWEEGEGPEYSPDQIHRLIRRGIHGRIYDKNGSNPVPPYPNDVLISDDSSVLHAENPSSAYSEDSNRYLVVYEENPTYNRWQIYIKGALMKPDGFVYTPFTISQPLQGGIQYFPINDPYVTYDEFSNQFFVVFSKSDTTWNYNVLGKFYDNNGNQIGSQVQIAATSDYEGQPWVVTDNLGHFLVVYEQGPHATNGPFSLKAKMYDYNGNQIGSEITVASGSSSEDNIFPSVSYNSLSQQFSIVWNTGDVSDNDFNGEINIKLFDSSGNLEAFSVVQSGTVYKVADSVPILSDMFFVVYDDDYTDQNRILSRLVTENGVVVDQTHELSDALYGFEKEMANSAVSDGNIMVVWEDDRLTVNIPPTEIRRSVWRSEQTYGDSAVSVVVGDEKKRVLSAQVTSVVIAPEDLVEWEEFKANVTLWSGCSVVFDILDASYSTVLMSDISPGELLNSLSVDAIRLRAKFSRSVATNSSVLDSWGVVAVVGSDIEPPWTDAVFTPDVPNGENGWYISPINITLTAYDNDSPPENVTTYYKIDEGPVKVYENASVIVFDVEGSGLSFEYWSEDNAGNEELPHNVVSDLLVDYTDPFITINEPPDIVLPGDVLINGTVTEYSSGSGISLVRIRINDETVFEDTYEEFFTWFDWIFTANYGESFDILVQAFDEAGNFGRDRRLVVCSERGLYTPGYVYLFDNPKYGPLSLLESLNMAVAIDQSFLYVAIPSVHPDASKVEFIAYRLITDQQEVYVDTNVSDGVYYDLPLSSGFYELTARAYDSAGVPLDDYVIISKMLVLML